MRSEFERYDAMGLWSGVGLCASHYHLAAKPRRSHPSMVVRLTPHSLTHPNQPKAPRGRIVRAC